MRRLLTTGRFEESARLNNVGKKTNPLTLQPSLTLLALLFVGGLTLVAGLAIVPTPVHATTTTLVENRRQGSILPHVQVSGQGSAAIRSSDVLTTYIYLPLIARAEVCQPIPGESYGSFTAYNGPTNPPAEEHPDLNLALRGYTLTNAYKGLVNYNGEADPNAPQLPGLFADNRTATFSNVYRVYDWDWSCNCRGGPITDWPVTLAGLATTPGETIHVPGSGYTIGGGYEVLVLYATPERITLKYTPDDHVIWGYTIHLENICVEPNLLALYQLLNDAGRSQLPALRAGQALGRARGDEIGVVIRDNGAFMDPRSRKDWWQGR